MHGINLEPQFDTMLTRRLPQELNYIDNVNSPDVFADGTLGIQISDLEGGQIQEGMLADASVTTAAIADLAVDTEKLAELAVEAAKLADSSVESTKIANLAVGSAAIALLAVGTVHVANGAILNAKIGDAQINNAKISDLSADKINVGTLTGINVWSSVDSNRVGLINGNYLSFYYAGSQRGFMRSESTSDITISANDDVQFRAGGSIRCKVANAAFKPLSDNAYGLGEKEKRFNKCFATTFYGGTGGDAGTTTAGYGYVNGIRWDGSTLQYRFSEMKVDGGIVGGFDEGSWNDV